MKPIAFGTDGIRGKAGDFPMDVQGIAQIATAVARALSPQRVVIAKDTRISGQWIVECIVDTLTAYGVTVLDCGVLPTAALACCVLDENADLGIVATASHNPWHDNGIKIFNNAGKKLSDKQQQAIESALQSKIAPKRKPNGSLIKPVNPEQHWIRRLPVVDLQGTKILLDCANGALSGYGKSILESLGANVTTIASSPSGYNINAEVGALHPPVDLKGCDIALCFDGDADRITMVSKTHGVLDGDDFLWILRHQFTGPMIGTVMSNGGLEEALESRLKRSKVGDRYVYEMMKETGAGVGAEPSGHVIFADGKMPVGDGLYAALRILGALRSSETKEWWKRWPTAQSSIRFSGEKIDLSRLQSLSQATESNHRIVVRYSGTEPKLRILVEGADADHWCQSIATEFRKVANV